LGGVGERSLGDALDALDTPMGNTPITLSPVLSPGGDSLNGLVIALIVANASKYPQLYPQE